MLLNDSILNYAFIFIIYENNGSVVSRLIPSKWINDYISKNMWIVGTDSKVSGGFAIFFISDTRYNGNMWSPYTKTSIYGVK